MLIFQNDLYIYYHNEHLLISALNDHGDIEFKNMPSKVDAKASTKQGDIRFKYDSKPEDTILKLNPGTGDSVVKNKTFTNGKVGKSDNVLEFYTIDGNIKVE
ncbi:exported protein [Staphylococcus aureus]|nr:exported protein [Staphylococcus aureus]